MLLSEQRIGEATAARPKIGKAAARARMRGATVIRPKKEKMLTLKA